MSPQFEHFLESSLYAAAIGIILAGIVAGVVLWRITKKWGKEDKWR